MAKLQDMMQKGSFDPQSAALCRYVFSKLTVALSHSAWHTNHIPYLHSAWHTNHIPNLCSKLTLALSHSAWRTNHIPCLWLER